MTERALPVPSLSLKSLAQFLAEYPRNDKLWEQGELELYEPLEAWDARIRAGIETPQTCKFRQRYAVFCSQHVRRSSWPVSALARPKWVVTPSDAFIWTELQAFIDQADELGRERREIVDKLGATPEDIERIYELCFIPTVIFPCVLEIAAQYKCLHEAALKERRRLQGLINRLESDSPLASAPLKTQLQQCADRARDELELIGDVFGVKYPTPAALDTWRKHLGINKRTNIEPQKHHIWRYICRDLVDCIKPYCEVHKKKTKKPLEVPTDARNIAARLLHLSAPNLWPDGPEGQTVENRYRAAIREEKKYASLMTPISDC
jgi:hypothetical protein